MAVKRSDFLDRIPSASELLDKPPIRALAGRWNRSVVAAGVRSFLDEVRSDLERRAAEVHLPSLRDLAERAARHVATMQQSAARPAINATGQFIGPDWSCVPLSDSALERMIALGSGFARDARDDGPGDAPALVARLTGAEAAIVVHSYAGAVWMALAAIAANREIVIARGEVGTLDRAGSLVSIASTASVTLREVGSVNRSSAADYEAAIAPATAALWRNLADDYEIVGDCAAAEIESLVALARDRELPLVESLGAAALIESLPAIDVPLPNVAASIAAGSFGTIVRGNGLVGGPPCGILVGTREFIRRVESHPMFPAWRADPATAAALAATLALYGDPEQMRMEIPLFQLLGASVENLRQRAERLAPQMAQAEDVESALAVATENYLGAVHATHHRIPSYAIELTAADGDVLALDRRLRAATVPVVGRCLDDRLLVDLRTVLPRQDQRLVQSVVGETAGMHYGETSGIDASLEPSAGDQRS